MLNVIVLYTSGRVEQAYEEIQKLNLDELVYLCDKLDKAKALAEWVAPE